MSRATPFPVAYMSLNCVQTGTLPAMQRAFRREVSLQPASTETARTADKVQAGNHTRDPNDTMASPGPPWTSSRAEIVTVGASLCGVHGIRPGRGRLAPSMVPARLCFKRECGNPDEPLSFRLDRVMLEQNLHARIVGPEALDERRPADARRLFSSGPSTTSTRPVGGTGGVSSTLGR